MITKAMVPNLIVKTCSGLLRGKESLSTRKKPFRSFLGIPYAQPPARFSPARPLVGDWTGVREATEYGSDAAQYDLVSK